MKNYLHVPWLVYVLLALCVTNNLLVTSQVVLLDAPQPQEGLGTSRFIDLRAAHNKNRQLGIANAKKFVNLTSRNGGLDGIELDGRQACREYLEGDERGRLDINQLLRCQYKNQQDRMLMIQNELERRDKGKLRPYSRDEYSTEVVNPHRFKFYHQPEPCSPDETVVVSIHSAIQNRHKRAVIRQTWANPKLLSRYLQGVNKTKLVFTLGAVTEASLQRSIDYESELYRDIIQASFVDEYYNNTYKALYHFKWVSGKDGCPLAKLIIKADDDIMFNLRKMPAFWNKFSSTVGTLQHDRMLIAGNLYALGPMRDRREKWYIPYDKFPYDTFPPWFQGMVYFITPGLAKRMYYFSFTTPYIFTDDVYIGILSDRVPNIERYNFVDFYEFAYEKLETKTLKWKLDPEVFYHNPTFSDMLHLWYTSCSVDSCS